MTISKGTPKLYRVSWPKPGSVAVWEELEQCNNITTYRGSDITAKLLAGKSEYALNTAYFEFTSSTSPSITPDRTDPLGYYAGLGSTLHQDYIRVPIIIPSYFLTSDDTKYLYNVANFDCQTSGTTGVHGKTFDTSCTVYGIALATALDIDDPTQDLVYARTYSFTPIPKVANEQIGYSWPVTIL